MRTSRHDPAARWRNAGAAVALATGIIAGGLAALQSATAQEPGPPPAPDAVPQPSPDDLTTLAPAPPPPPAGPLRILSWNVASSPYAVAMRKLKATPPAWRTSFGSERRTIVTPMPPQASAIDADVVLMQGITNPRALRRLFPARKWRLLFSRRALETLPKGSVFTTPVSSAEVEAVAVRFRHGLRITSGPREVEDAPQPPADATAAGSAPASMQDETAPVPVAPARPPSPGVSVRLIDRGRTLWLASVSLKSCPPSASACDKREMWQRWRSARNAANEGTVTGGDTATADGQTPCSGHTIEIAPPTVERSPPAKAQSRDVLGCVAELTLP